MKKTRRKFSSSFNTKVVLEALKERHTLQELASKYELRSSQIVSWKKDFLAKASLVFDSKDTGKTDTDNTEQLYNKIGHMQVQIHFLKKVLDK